MTMHYKNTIFAIRANTGGFMRLVSSGYTLEVRKDQKDFCRREAALGTRFARETCQSEEQILANTQDSKDLTRQFQNPTQYPQGIARQ